jgi:hypothetical protein
VLQLVEAALEVLDMAFLALPECTLTEITISEPEVQN